MPRNIIDDWWAQGKDEHVTGKRSRKQKKFDDDESSTEQPDEQPDAKKSKSKSAVAKAPKKKSTVNKTTSKSSKMMGSSIAVEDLVNYRVLGVFTKSYNKWMLCDIGRQAWNEGMNKGKYRVLLRMIRFDHIRGAWEDNDPSLRIKWKQMRSYFVLADASDISDVVEKLGVH